MAVLGSRSQPGANLATPTWQPGKNLNLAQPGEVQPGNLADWPTWRPAQPGVSSLGGLRPPKPHIWPIHDHIWTIYFFEFEMFQTPILVDMATS